MDLTLEGKPEYAQASDGSWFYRWVITIQYADVHNTVRTHPVGAFHTKENAYEHAVAHEDKVIAAIVESTRDVMDVDEKVIQVEQFPLSSGTRERGN